MSACHHKSLFQTQTILYCLTLSTFFVSSLYIFIPPAVRSLPRDDPLQIKWRTAVIVVVVTISLGVYPWLFCQSEGIDGDNGSSLPQPFYVYLGISRVQPIAASMTHVAILYLGSFSCTWAQIYHHARVIQRQKNAQQSAPLIIKPQYVYDSFLRIWAKPKKVSLQLFCTDECFRWMSLRNLLIAPIVEEVIFRSCMIPPLLKCGFTPVASCWIAPQFFGVAHLHHVYMKRQQLSSSQMMVGLVFQWAYTTLFGAYASHVFSRTGSFCGVVAVHAFCNYLGLPELQFVSRQSVLFPYRWLIGLMYLIGIGLFVLGFNAGRGLFPEVPVLPDKLDIGTSYLTSWEFTQFKST